MLPAKQWSAVTHVLAMYAFLCAVVSSVGSPAFSGVEGCVFVSSTVSQ